MSSRDYSICPATIRDEAQISWNKTRPGLISRFRAVLESAKDEVPLQDFFAANPLALVFGTQVRTHQVWVFPQPQFGTIEGLDSVPDFLICDWSSVGPQWIVVELESPTTNVINTRGISAKCNFPIQQVMGYRRFFSERVESLNLAGWTGLNGDCKAWILIGRRNAPRSKKNADRLSEFRNQDIEIASYDRVFESCSETQRGIDARHREVRRTVKKHPFN
jgi:hypothetical protein